MAVFTMITADDLAVSLGRDSLASIERAQFESWIDEALYLINRKVSETTPPEQKDIDYVVRRAVLEVADQPTPGVIQESVQVDDAAVTTRYAKAKRRVEILPEWWEILGVVDGKAGLAFSVDLTAGVSTIHALTCSLYFGATYCSCGADIAGYPIFEPV